MRAIRASGPLGSWETRAIVITMMPVLIALSILQMGSGFVLETLEETYLANPVLFVMVPVMIDMGGNLGTLMSSRLSTRIHLGLVSFKARDPKLLTDIGAVLSLALSIFALLGVVAWVIGLYVLGRPMALVDLMTISLVSGMLLAVLAIVVSVGATWLSYRWGLDPDDTTIPVVTNVCDILGVIILSGVALLVV